ncbi:MAG: hypothetical protein ABIK89_12770 [Planctomycetota bacterium]
MKWLGIALSVGFLLSAVPALAQNPATADIRFGSTISLGEVTPTPEMWFYQQYAEQYQDPKVAVRQKAEERAAQRRARIAAQKWYGFSNIRPTAGIDPVHGDYSPAWSGRNANYPFRWSGYGAAAVVVRPVISRSVY